MKGFTQLLYLFAKLTITLHPEVEIILKSKVYGGVSDARMYAILKYRRCQRELRAYCRCPNPGVFVVFPEVNRKSCQLYIVGYWGPSENWLNLSRLDCFGHVLRGFTTISLCMYFFWTAGDCELFGCVVGSPGCHPGNTINCPKILIL